MFEPPRCPYRHCTHHHSPAARWYRRHGQELCSWRQDWGEKSIQPLARSAESVEQWMEKRVARA